MKIQLASDLHLEFLEADLPAQRLALQRLAATFWCSPVTSAIRALASICAGLLTRHLGDPKAINKLARLSQSFDDFRHNETAKAMVTLLEDAAGGPYDPTEQDWIDLAARAGISLDDYKC